MCRSIVATEIKKKFCCILWKGAKEDYFGFISVALRWRKKCKERHPNPGQLYSGTHRVAYLPNNRRGQTVGKMLQKAFEKLFIFKVGTSMTTGVSNTVVWSGQTRSLACLLYYSYLTTRRVLDVDDVNDDVNDERVLE
uniref:E3 ubiquitin-protein ligase n=1 Tax=Romanomermis culicivorax TaxID=13658 RepID=A0A915J526_ROMCU